MMKFTWDNLLIGALLLFVIIFPFWKGADGNYGQIWEDVSVVATLTYAIIIYMWGFFGGKFGNLSDPLKGIIGFIVILLIPILSISFIIGFVRIWFPSLDGFYGEYFAIPRTVKMVLLILVSILFLIVDYIMLKKADTNKINYATNLYQGDFPVVAGFIVLGLYAFYLGDQAIETNKLNHFFEGAIAFQMIFSNIIWMYNDDEFWKSNTASDTLIGGK